MSLSKLKLMVVVAVGMLAGCTHSIEVKNLNQYRNLSSSPLPRKVSVGIISNSETAEARMLVKSISTELAKYSAEATLPYTPGISRPVDIIANVQIKETYEGSGWNFLINFPGFIVFAPAWNGYVYNVGYDFDVRLTDARTSASVGDFSIPVRLDTRHADMNRTWTQISWLEVGAIALIGGIVYTTYDDTVTPKLLDKVQQPLGDMIAQEMVTRIGSYRDLPMQLAKE